MRNGGYVIVLFFDRGGGGSPPRESCNIYSSPYRARVRARRRRSRQRQAHDKHKTRGGRERRFHFLLHLRVKLASTVAKTQEGAPSQKISVKLKCRAPLPRWKTTWGPTRRPSPSLRLSSEHSSRCPVSRGTRGRAASRGGHKRGSISSTDSARKVMVARWL